MSLSLEKSSLRVRQLRQRESLGLFEAERLSVAAQSRLIETSFFERLQVLALYSPIRNEVATGRLLGTALAAGKQVCYPVVDGDGLRFFRVESARQLKPGAFGVLEPERSSVEVAPARIEMLLVPGLAFDLQGGRLGYGRGYFDRFLSEGRFSGQRIGLCYDFQVLDQLPAEEHDQKVDLLVTDKRLISPL